MDMLLIMVVFIGLMYVLMVLPQKRKMDAQRKLLDSLEPGARVVLNTGIFGTIRATGSQQMVVELAPGVEVTVLRQAVLRQVTPAEEEFEYADEASAELEVSDSFNADAEQPSETSQAPDTAEALLATDAEQATEEPSEAAEQPTDAAEQPAEVNFYGQVVESGDADRPQDR